MPNQMDAVLAYAQRQTGQSAISYGEQMLAGQFLAQQRQQAQALHGHPDVAALTYAQHRQPAQPLQGHQEVMRGGYPHQQQQQQAQAAQAQAQVQAQAQDQGGDKRNCPPTGWQYVDPKGNVQGPFTLLEMQLWNSMGYFRPDLPMRCDPTDPFVEFNKLFPPPLVPFESCPRRVASNGGAVGMGGR